MKFPQLPLAARFEFQGRAFVKTGLMVATPEDGGKAQIIPRWADVSPVGDAGKAPATKTSRCLDEGRVKEAFATYHTRCVDLLAQACSDDNDEVQLQAALEQARQAFVDSLSP